MDGRTATFALTLPGRHPVDLATALAAHGVAAGAGTFHSPGITNALGLTDGALRIGILHYNTDADIDHTLTTLAAAARVS